MPGVCFGRYEVGYILPFNAVALPGRNSSNHGSTDSVRSDFGRRRLAIRDEAPKTHMRPMESHVVHLSYGRPHLTFAKSSLRLPCLPNIMVRERRPPVVTIADKQHDGGISVPIGGRAAVTQVEAPANSVSAKTLAALWP